MSFLLDLLSNYQWDRPLNFLSAGGDLKIGIKDYLMYDGFTYRFVPIKNRTNRSETGFTDTVLYGFSNEKDLAAMIEAYYLGGAPEKASVLCTAMSDQLLYSGEFFLYHYEFAEEYFDTCYTLLSVLCSVADEHGDTALASSIRDRFNNLLE